MVKIEGMGPVIGREWRILARRWQWYAARTIFVAGLLAALATAAWSGRKDAVGIRGAAQAATRFFAAISGIQLGLVLLVAPAATAGAICVEKERGTLSHVLVTDLTGAEIVVGKLAAQLVPVVGLIACGLPVMQLTTLLGGVNPDALLGAALIAAGAAAAGCSLALVLSVWGTRTHEVLLVTYAACFLWVASGPGWWVLNRTGLLVIGAPAWVNQSNPILLTMGLAWGPGRTEWPEIGRFVAGCVVTATALTTLAVVALRPVTAHQFDGPDRQRKVFRLARSLGPSLDRNPVLWLEWHRRGRRGWSGLIWKLYGGLAFATTAIMITLVYQRGIGVGSGLGAMLNGMQVSAGMLILVVSATTALAAERAAGGWDVLLATPIDSPAIVLGKWWAAFRMVPLMAIPAGVSALAVATQSGRYAGVALVMGLVLSYGAALSSLGLALSTWVAHSARAATLGVGAHLLVTVGWFFLIVVLTPGAPGFRGPGLAAASPFCAVGFTTIATQLSRGGEWFECIRWMVFWITTEFLVAAALLWATLATFDRCVGRISARGRARGPGILIRRSGPEAAV
jgi:ABC-type transport system involved in multi-copper enzyme maturation permease subunit